MKPGVLTTCLGVQGDKETSGCSGDVVMSWGEGDGVAAWCEGREFTDGISERFTCCRTGSWEVVNGDVDGGVRINRRVDDPQIGARPTHKVREHRHIGDRVGCPDGDKVGVGGQERASLVVGGIDEDRK